MSLEIKPSTNQGLYNLTMEGSNARGLVPDDIAAEIRRLQRCEAALEVAEEGLRTIATNIGNVSGNGIVGSQHAMGINQGLKWQAALASDRLVAIAKAKAGSL